MSQNALFRIVLTGGPCGGKTSAFAYLREKLHNLGVAVVCIPEVATTVFTNGVPIAEILAVPDGILLMQEGFLKKQLADEENMERFLRILPGERKLLLCDRGALDIAAYISPRDLEITLHETKNAREELLKRYDAVVHLVSAADGAEEHYNFDNAARTETPEQARMLDARTQHAWIGHERLHIIPNINPATGKRVAFDEKLADLFRTVCLVLGIPAPLEIEQKHLLDLEVIGALPSFPVPLHASDITQTYLVSDSGAVERRIRARRRPGESVFNPSASLTYTEKRPVAPGVRNEAGRMIDLRSYLLYEEQERDPDAEPIRKVRHNFVWEYQYFHLDVIEHPLRLTLVEVETTDAQQEVRFPPFLAPYVLRNVTDDPRYANAAIARRQCPGYA